MRVCQLTTVFAWSMTIVALPSNRTIQTDNHDITLPSLVLEMSLFLVYFNIQEQNIILNWQDMCHLLASWEI